MATGIGATILLFAFLLIALVRALRRKRQRLTVSRESRKSTVPLTSRVSAFSSARESTGSGGGEGGDDESGIRVALDGDLVRHSRRASIVEDERASTALEDIKASAPPPRVCRLSGSFIPSGLPPPPPELGIVRVPSRFSAPPVIIDPESPRSHRSSAGAGGARTYYYHWSTGSPRNYAGPMPPRLSEHPSDRTSATETFSSQRYSADV